MPSLTLDSGVHFFYTDSGAVPGNSDYTTLVIIHGHTFHSGTFQRLTPFAQPNSLRIISVNRREYPGSSLYSDEEIADFADGDDTRRTSLLQQQGRDLALFLDGLIATLSLPQAGGIALIGWSLGAIFLLSLVAALETLPERVRLRLAEFVRTIILFQVPDLALGLPLPPGFLIPATDPAIPLEAKGPAFAKWVSSHFLHGDLSTRQLENLTYDKTDPAKPPTIELLTPEELLGMTDFAPAERYDSIVGLPPFAGLVYSQMMKALFDPAVRAGWGHAQFWCIYGTAEPWSMLHGAWFLEDACRERVRAHPELAIHFKLIDRANHFLVWEEPERAINVLKECLAKPVQSAEPTHKTESKSLIARFFSCLFGCSFF